MSDKRKTFALPISKPVKSTQVQSSVRKTISTTKKRNVPRLNTTLCTKVNLADVTICKADDLQDYEEQYRQIAYGKFMRTMLEACLVREKFEREETEVDVQMCQLAERFNKTTDQLDKTSRRLKEISFIVEQKRLADLKSNDYTQFHEMSQKSNAEELLQNLASTEQALLDKLETKNVDFGYNKETGHKQLLDAVTDAIDGLAEIKKHSNLDVNKFKEYEKTQSTLNKLEREKFDLESMRLQFEKRFPNFNESLIKDASERISQLLDNNDSDE
ncbi:hypothetical protein RR48_03176 [Papilio machaon]|uniref:Uncharacterized protein n=1 Tax=Papilio machaon TaxID=76193 RepID=A0A0N1II32_PAPMA|nr:hypothetical protein RR48_03176 [Papilio machaon]